MKKHKWLILALLMAILLPACAFSAPYVMEALFWKIGDDPAVAVLQGEHFGRIICMALLVIAPFVPILCFIMERIGVWRARRHQERGKPSEFSAQEVRKEFYRKELKNEGQISHGSPWIVYGVLCGVAVFIFGNAVLRAGLPEQIEETGRDLAAYHSGQPASYEGPLLLVERQLRDGFRQLPDERFVYYDGSDCSFRCAASLLSQPNLMQESYKVAYLPETGTILTITDAEGNLRTAGESVELPTPEGCWMYGDLAVPVCSEVDGYSNLSSEQKALFDLMYSEVLSGGVAAGKIPTRSFDLPYPLEKEEFNAVLDLYEASTNPEQRPTHGYRTDDGRIVRRAYCYGIIYAN